MNGSTSDFPAHLRQSTYLATARTLLAMIRTGAAIAGGGALVTALLGKEWPRWVVMLLSSAFVVLGYWLMWSALTTGQKMRAQMERERAQDPALAPLISHKKFTALTVAIQVLIAAVVGLYLLHL